MLGNISKIKTVSHEGFNVVDTEVQVHLGSGLPCFNIVGMANRAVMEARERVRAVLGSLGLGFPSGRVVVNLSPINVVKDGNHYDLPIALALLTAMKVLPRDSLKDYICVGELGLDGSLLNTSGVLAAAVFAGSKKYAGIVCPGLNGREAAWVRSIDVKGAQNLLQVIDHINRGFFLPKFSPPALASNEKPSHDISQIKGQETAKRALEVAAVGRHNMLFIGPPGAGKSMLARALVSILPPLTERDLLIVSMIHSLCGNLNTKRLSLRRPFRSPHHTSSAVALVGGGSKALPGEISLCHGGVLFLDELPEFNSYALDALREPLESGVISIARASRSVQYPADFQLVAAMNPCRCGGGEDTYYVCRRGGDCAAKYQSKISGPLLDRLDIKMYIPALTMGELLQKEPRCESSATVLERVIHGRQMQDDYLKEARVNRFSEEIILRFFNDRALQTLKRLIHSSKISARGYNCLLRLSRTIASLEQRDHITTQCVLEAFMYHRIQHDNISIC